MKIATFKNADNQKSLSTFQSVSHTRLLFNHPHTYNKVKSKYILVLLLEKLGSTVVYKTIDLYIFLAVIRIDEENAATQERVSLTIHRHFTEEFLSLECTRIVKEVIR